MSYKSRTVFKIRKGAVVNSSSRQVIIKNYGFSLILLVSITAGAIAGLLLKERAVILKPFGDLFLNLLFTAVVPVVFFSISSSVASISDLKKLRRIMFWMITIFVSTAALSACLTILGVKLFPPAIDAAAFLGQGASALAAPAGQVNFAEAFTVPDFALILSKKSVLALIIFAFLVGLAASASGPKGKMFADFLVSGNEVMMKLIGFIILYAPAGLGAYFAYLTGVFGPELFGTYMKVVTLYSVLAFFYFFAGSTFYAWLAGGLKTVRLFWSHILTPSLTALATGSSLATIPSNLQAADNSGIPKEVSRIIIPIGASIHSDGTAMSAIIKISLLFSVFNMEFSGIETYATAIGVAILSSVVMSGIPGGGFLGELMIVTLYGFPPEALPIITMVGTLVDAPATMVNATGDNVVSMLVSRIIYGKNWAEKPAVSVR